MKVCIDIEKYKGDFKVDPKQLLKGAKIESKEHSLPFKLGEKIALDHIIKGGKY